MSGDYTRLTHDPAKRYSGVLMQQGRVQLDADWNEAADIGQRRDRMLALDSFGAIGVPQLTTPDAFKIGALPGGDLSIGAGRLYVDGLVAEILPGENWTYLNQPFLPAPDALPTADTVVYLDIWEREVSWVQDSELLDVALGGADTATRRQIVWQVRAEARSGAACGQPVGEPPSAGRLTTRAIAPPAAKDPCILPPSGGYRGLENRLYRVEVHEGGPLATARFRWSRDNGSIVAAVVGLTVSAGDTTLELDRIGRDPVRRFGVGDWVALTDDVRELHGRPVQMAKIASVDEAERRVTLDRPVPVIGDHSFPSGPTAGPDLVARAVRLQKWDQTAATQVDGDGLIAAAASTPIPIEDGIEVEWSVDDPSGLLRTGDWWCFAARVADASVETLTAAPPRGVNHHYAQLAAITAAPGGATVSDCRPKPNLGCCISVAPGDVVQKAIDALPDVGGCVCLKAGVHELTAPIEIARDNVALHGESLGAIVVNRRGGELLVVRECDHSRVHTLTMRQGRAGGAPIVRLQSVSDFAIADCSLETEQESSTIGILAAAAEDVEVRDCRFARPATGIWFDKGCGDATVKGCTLDMARNSADLPDSVALLAREMRGSLTVEANTIRNALNGIVIDDDPGGIPHSRARMSRVTGNRIGLVFNPNASESAFAIDVAAQDAIIAHNHIVSGGGRGSAIRLCGDGSSATDNRIEASRDAGNQSVAIAVGHDSGVNIVPVSNISVSGNTIDGPRHGIVATHLAGGDLRGNFVGRRGKSLVAGIMLDRAQDCSVSDNTIIGARTGILAVSGARNSIRNNGIRGGLIGIIVGREEAPAISECRVNETEWIGIAAVAVIQRCEIVSNRIVRCGAGVDAAAGIFALIVWGEWHVEANEVMDIGVPPEESGADPPPLAFGLWGDRILEARIESNLVTYGYPPPRPLDAEDRALRLRGMIEFVISDGVTGGFAAQIAGNKFIGPGATALVELFEERDPDGRFFARFERAMFSGNFCWHLASPVADNKDRATVHLVGRALSVSGNQVKATVRSFPSYNLFGTPGPFLGNVSQGPTLGRNPVDQLPSPENAFNLIL